MKNYITENFKYIFGMFIFLIIYTFLSCNVYAQSMIYYVGVSNDLNPNEIDIYGNKIKTKALLEEHYKYAVNQISKAIVKRIKNSSQEKFYSWKNDLFIAISLEDINKTPNNKLDDYLNLLATTRLGPLIFPTEYESGRDQTSPRYSYKTFFFISRNISSAKYSMEEFVPAGFFGENLETNSYTYDFIQNGSLKGSLITVDPYFEGVLKSLSITGN